MKKLLAGCWLFALMLIGVANHAAAQPKTTSKTIVFIHGMSMTGECWNAWKTYYESKGYTCYAPSWPMHDQPLDSLRAAHPNKALHRIGIDSLVAHYERFISGLPEKPILIGHSLGGLVTQKLLNRGHGAAGIVLHSAPPQGIIIVKWSFLRGFMILANPFKGRMPVKMSQRQFNYVMANGLEKSVQEQLYLHTVPESRRVARNVLTKSARVRFKKPHAPLLFVASKADHVIPARLNRKNARKYRRSPQPADYKEFPNRPHIVLLQDGWQEIADYALDWCNGTAK